MLLGPEPRQVPSASTPSRFCWSKRTSSCQVPGLKTFKGTRDEMGREGILGGRPLGGGSQRGHTLLVALRTCLPCVNGGGDLAASLAGRPRRSPVHRGRSPGQPNGFSKEEGTTRPGHVNQWDGRLPFPSLPTPERWPQGCWPLRAHGRWDWLPGSRLCDKTLSTPPPGRPPGRFTGGPRPGSPRVAGLGALA